MRAQRWFADGSLYRVDLSGARLGRADLHGANLYGADLSGADLTHADLSNLSLGEGSLRGADLRGARLTRAYLYGSDLRGANLSHADLTHADLMRANLHAALLHGANLSQARLTGVDLRGTEFRGAVIRGADFSGALCGNTVFADINLGSARALETVYHEGPSQISIDSLFFSRDGLPLEFLRGCGVPESLIARLTPLLGEAFEYFSCFIAHNRADKDFAARLYAALQAQGIRCWRVEYGADPDPAGYEVRPHDKVLMVLSAASVGAWWIDYLVGMAREKEREAVWQYGGGYQVAHVLTLDDSLARLDDFTEARLRERVVADFAGWDTDPTRFERALTQVIEALRDEL